MSRPPPVLQPALLWGGRDFPGRGMVDCNCQYQHVHLRGSKPKLIIQNKTKNTESIDLYIEREELVISDRACVHPHGARVSEEDARDHWVGRTSFFHFC